jgi:fructosamine-3-kinase
MVTDLRSLVAAAIDADVIAMYPLGGGDVADSYRVVLDGGATVFAKTKANAVPGFFTTEAVGLTWLREAGTVAVPEVLAVSDEPAFLVQEWIEPGYPEPSTERDFGLALAQLHQTGAALFGREDRRSTGSRGLPNEPCATWAEFYATQRLTPLARLARDGNALPERSIVDLERVAVRIDDLVGPAEPPARLHGDLWGGNRLIGAGGVSWLIDPAAHGGHREFDLAMMRLFGGFGRDCYAAYDEISPLSDGWAGRIPLHQLAPLVVHSIKFGGAYVPATQQALAALIS